jgi:hypothetical protein
MTDRNIIGTTEVNMQVDDADEDGEHFPWHYTEYGVLCACGDAMDADENCLSKTRHLT